MSKSRAIFCGMLALPLLYAVSCSGRVSDQRVSMEDAGSAGMVVDAPPVHDSGLSNTDCSKLTVGQCAAGNDCQVLEAQLQSPRCASDFEAVGCASGETICGAAETRAADPQGRQWLLLSTCIPLGWRLLAPNTPDSCGLDGAAN